MSNIWGLTEKGFYRPTYVEILNALEYKARELFPDKVNLTVRSPIGIFLRIYAWMLNILFSVLEDVYNSRFIDTAVGTSLYNLGMSIGLRVLPAGKATGYVTITAQAGTTIPAGYLVGTPGGLQYTVMSPVTVGSSGKVLALIQAVENGTEYNTPAGTINMIINPASVPGVISVNNESDVIGGRERETDDEYRQRYYDSVDYAGGVNADAVRAALLQDVAGIYTAYVYENDSDVWNEEYNLPPHSIEAVVYGGLDADIARVIYDRKAGGIQTVGSETVPVLSASQQSIEVHFSRPDPVDIYIQNSGLKTNSNFAGPDTIVQALTNYIGGSASGGLEIGEDVIYIAIPGVIMDVAGVVDFKLGIGTKAGEYSENNIEIGIRQKAVTSEEMVVIS